MAAKRECICFDLRVKLLFNLLLIFQASARRTRNTQNAEIFGCDLAYIDERLSINILEMYLP